MVTNLLKGNTKDIPKMSPEKMLKVASTKEPEFKKAYMLAKRVLANSTPEVKNEKVLNLSAMSVALKATIAKKTGRDMMVATKDILKNLIKSYRKKRDESKPSQREMPPEHKAELVLGWVSFSLILSLVGVLYVKLIPIMVSLLPKAVGLISNISIPNMTPMFKGFIDYLKNWDLASASPTEIGGWVILTTMAGAGLMAYLTSARR
jgi:hypothetical protein